MNTVAYATILASILPVCYYIYVGLRKDSRATTLDDFFIYERKVNAKDFANTSVGYALQMAALFLFADWGIRYGFGALWVPLFWGLGFLLLYLLIPKLDYFVSENWTLHGYLRNRFNSSALQWVAALATIIGLWGTMMVEIDYATTIYQPFFPTKLSSFFLGMFFLAFGYIYISFGGYKAEVNTERIQVPVAYTALLLIILVLVFHVRLSGLEREFWILNAFLFVCFILMLKAKIGIVPGRPFADQQLWIPIICIVAQVGIACLPLRGKHLSSPISVGLFEDWPKQLRAQGVWNLLSLFAANALWQLVDLSSWQRLSSINLEMNNDRARFDPIRRGIWRVMIESPVSWMFGVAFGMALKCSGFVGQTEDPSAAIGNFVTALVKGGHSIASLGRFSWVLYPVLVAAVIAIMLSTVHALICAVSFTAFKDLQPLQARTLNKARVYSLVFVIIGGILYYILRFVSDAGIATALYAFYASQLSLFPSVIATFLLRHPNRFAALFSILSGIASAFIVAYGVVERHPDLSLSPPLFSFLTSTIVYLVIWIVLRKKNP